MVAGYCSRRVERFWGVFGRLVQFRETEVASHQRQLINVVTATLTKSSVIFVLIVILYFLIIFFWRILLPLVAPALLWWW